MMWYGVKQVEVDYYSPAGSYQGVFVVENEILHVVGERQGAIADRFNGMKVASIENMLVEMGISITQNDDLAISNN